MTIIKKISISLAEKHVVNECATILATWLDTGIYLGINKKPKNSGKTWFGVNKFGEFVVYRRWYDGEFTCVTFDNREDAYECIKRILNF